jgi:hypothetical protein
VNPLLKHCGVTAVDIHGAVADDVVADIVAAVADEYATVVDSMVMDAVREELA